MSQREAWVAWIWVCSEKRWCGFPAVRSGSCFLPLVAEGACHPEAMKQWWGVQFYLHVFFTDVKYQVLLAEPQRVQPRDWAVIGELGQNCTPAASLGLCWVQIEDLVLWRPPGWGYTCLMCQWRVENQNNAHESWRNWRARRVRTRWELLMGCCRKKS